MTFPSPSMSAAYILHCKEIHQFYMRIEVLSTALTYFDMKIFFQIIPTATIEQLTQKLQTMFACHAALCKTADDLSDNPTDTARIALHDATTIVHAISTSTLKVVYTNTTKFVNIVQICGHYNNLHVEQLPYIRRRGLHCREPYMVSK